MTGPVERDEHTAALSRLVLAGWTGTPVGNPAEPAALAYVRDRGSIVDAVLVSGPDDAIATRKNVLGTVLRCERGTVADVVAEVLSW